MATEPSDWFVDDLKESDLAPKGSPDKDCIGMEVPEDEHNG